MSIPDTNRMAYFEVEAHISMFMKELEEKKNNLESK